MHGTPPTTITAQPSPPGWLPLLPHAQPPAAPRGGLSHRLPNLPVSWLWPVGNATVWTPQGIWPWLGGPAPLSVLYQAHPPQDLNEPHHPLHLTQVSLPLGTLLLHLLI